MEIGTSLDKKNWIYSFLTGLGVAVTCMVVFSIMHFIFYDDFRLDLGSYIQSLFMGITVGVGLPILSNIIAKRVKIVPLLNEQEQVEVEGPATYRKGKEGVGGKIFLTNKKFIFKSHKLNIQSGQTDIHYSEINTVFNHKTAKFFDNGIRLVTSNGVEHDFVVSDRDVWLAAIEERLENWSL